MRIRLLPAAVLALLSIPWIPSSRAEWRHLGDLTGHTHDGAVVTLTCGQARVQLTAVSAHCVRVRLAPDGQFMDDFSWAIEALTVTGRFEPQPAVDGALVFTTGALRVHVAPRPCRLSITDADNNPLVADEPVRGMSWGVAAPTGTAPVRVWQHFPDGARIFGLGEKSGGMRRENRTWVMWNSDTPAYGEGTDPIYASIPFFITAQADRYHGVFFDNPWRSSFDFNREQPGGLSFGAEGGALDYYVIAGPHPKDVIRRYTDLTGRMPLPPRWALGYQQCRYSYFPDARVRAVAHTFREKKIPCDVLYFDIDYMDGYRCFTWDGERFPDPRGLMTELADLGFRTIAIIDPGIKNEPGYAVYDTGSAIDAWVTQPDGTPYVGRVWPGDCVFPDFTADRVRDWWADLFPPFINSSGLGGVWNDMNEPANFAGPHATLPLDTRFANAGRPASHRAVHNVYGMQMARATREGLQRARPDERPFTLTRATFAGGQRHAAVWTGDNVSNWSHLAMSIPMCLSVGISGIPLVGPDIGGFVGGATPELFARWIQFGALMPFARTHTSCNNADQEPWSFGPRVEAIARAAIERRYAWLPYIYTLVEEASRTGTPIIRPLWLEQPDLSGWAPDSNFYLGSDILIAPKLTPGEESYWVNLPKGVWFEGNTGRIYGGNRWYEFPGDLETLVHFFRAGAIIPTQSPVQHTGENPAEPLILDVWPWGESTGTLYEDDGLTYDHQQGRYRRTGFSCSATEQGIIFKIDAAQGSFAPAAAAPPLLRIHRVPVAPGQVRLTADGDSQTAQPARSSQALAQATYHHDPATGVLTVRLAAGLGKAQEVRVENGRTAQPAPSPITLTFDGRSAQLNRPRGASAVSYPDGVGQFTVRWSRTAHTVLPRLHVPADDLPLMELELATQSTTQLVVRFATEADPETVVKTAPVGLTPDGMLHVYRVNMTDIAENKWTGTVYWMELEFTAGIRGNETIRVARITFTHAG